MVKTAPYSFPPCCESGRWCELCRRPEGGLAARLVIGRALGTDASVCPRGRPWGWRPSWLRRQLWRLAAIWRRPVRGLGDRVAQLTESAGVNPCGGCKRRAEYLNRVFPAHAQKR